MENPVHCGSNPEALGEGRGRCPLSHFHRTRVYLHWIGQAADEACPFCGHARLDGDSMFQCTGLDVHPADDVMSRYWRQKIKVSSTSIR
ncbi:hypothetical protein TNCV_5038391 [Trichonephila clavipes]|nr:hypothetical protein TNCV_5038391 [Trichonephila clavipes]